MNDKLETMRPPELGKNGVITQPIQQESKYGVGMDNRNADSTNGIGEVICKYIYDKVTVMMIQACSAPACCAVGADFMDIEEEIIL